jgi:hypothetical protein
MSREAENDIRREAKRVLFINPVLMKCVWMVLRCWIEVHFVSISEM